MIRGLAAPSIGYSQAHTSTRLAAQAASSATVSVTCTRSQEVRRVIFMARKTSGDSTRGVSHDIFPGIQDSFTTQGLSPGNVPIQPESGPVRPFAGAQAPAAAQPETLPCLGRMATRQAMHGIGPPRQAGAPPDDRSGSPLSGIKSYGVAVASEA